jgi:hypothetical protein
MQRLVIGSLVAAVVMFILGFIFYATPLMNMGFATATPEQQATVQAALKGLPTGTYSIPGGETPEAMAAYAAGPVAMVKVNSGGFAMFDPVVFVEGYLHMAVAAFFLGLVLWTIRDRVTDFGSRFSVVMWLSLAMVWFTRLGEPIWYHTDWRNALYVAATEWISFVVAGYILARWFVPAGAGAAKSSAVPAE